MSVVNLRPMISRDQVLHVARLARLRLSEDEIDRMSRELSSVLDHIEKISELDLDGVPPTSHVIEVENVMRPDEPRPSWPVERVLERARPTPRRRLPRPEPGPVSADAVKLSAAESIARIRAGELSAGDLFSAYRQRIERHNDELGAFLGPPRTTPAETRRSRSPGYPWQSRTCSAPRAFPPRPGRASSRDTRRCTRRPPCGGWRRRARR